MSPGPISPFFVISSTPYGGRGVFATQHIPKDTLILSCEAPFASVICRKFKKEVCAWCFSWSLEVMGKSSWSVTLPSEGDGEGKSAGGSQKKNGMGARNMGVWFCGEECRDSWLGDGEDTTDASGTSHAGIRGGINAALEMCLATMNKAKSLEELGDGRNISSTLLDEIWDRAEQLSSFSRSPTPVAENVVKLGKKIKTKVDHISPTTLSELELDTARFVLAGLLKKSIEELSKTPSKARSEQLSARIDHPVGTWSDVLDLQDNTLSHVQLKSHILASHIRIWAFIKFVVYLASSSAQGPSEQTKRLLQMLKKSVDTPNDARALLGREHGNVFGIWDTTPVGVDSEMLGWGLYSFGSYFNHDCSPTLHKKAKGRAMEYYTLRDVEAGDELCISYVEESDDVMKRRETLKEWFFECTCKKCEYEVCSRV